jgi:hypothetical protein
MYLIRPRTFIRLQISKKAVIKLSKITQLYCYFREGMKGAPF